MAHRIFLDTSGRSWDVWTVLPSSVERRRTPDAPPPAQDQRRKSEPRMMLDEQWTNGWLAFQTSGEKRRLAPYPENWFAADGEELGRLCDAATLVQPAREVTK